MTILFYVAAVVLLIISRTMMYALQDRFEMTVMRYLWWLMFENLAISLLYTVITVTLFPVEGVSIPDIAIRSLMCVSIILAIPNGLIIFYAAYRSKCEDLEAAQYQLQELREENMRLKLISEHEERRMVATQQASANERMPRMINLKDNSGALRLTINIDSLYYLESEDNYIKVYYKLNDKIVSYMLRCKTRVVEQSLQGTGMVRCHRSYIVNISKIQSVGEEHRMHFITLNDESIRRIPVSKSYYGSLMESLQSMTLTTR
jgi:DNA-binding LytR/AlgR family response regulator